MYKQLQKLLGFRSNVLML